MASRALRGTNPIGARSFGFAFNASGGAAVEKQVAKGGYYLLATQDCLVRVTTVGGTAVAALPSTQPAESAPNATQYCPANQMVPLDITAAGSVSALGATASAGTLNVIGPLLQAVNG